MNTTDKRQRCKDLVRAHYRSRMTDIRTLWEAYKADPEASVEDLGTWNEYGLCFDYVAKGTFTDQKRGFFRYQISCGGPQDEFRFFVDEQLDIDRIEYWYLDWFDGAKIIVRADSDVALWDEIWLDWKECEVQRYAMEKAAQ
jgi:hypothetical protein